MALHLLVDPACQGNATRQITLDLGVTPIAPPRQTRIETHPEAGPREKRRDLQLDARCIDVSFTAQSTETRVLERWRRFRDVPARTDHLKHPYSPIVVEAHMRFESSIPQRFRAQVECNPARLAIADTDTALTYAELGHAVNAVANAMIRRAGGPVQRVVLLMDQGVPAVTVTLGALCAGAAYVPLDPTLPATHLSDLVARADATLVVANRHYLELARSVVAGGTHVFSVEDLAGDRDGAEPAVTVSPDALAYIYFTSGSTGKPKGVFDNHRNVLHNVWRYTKNLNIGRDDRLTLLQAPHFSGVVSSMFCAVLNGAANFAYDVRRDGLERVGEWLRSNRITIFHSVPSIFREVIAGGDFPALRCVRLEGDRASGRDIDLFRRHCAQGTMLANGLGATECGLVRQWRIDTDTPIADGQAPIGEPIDDMDVRLLGDDRLEVPYGEVGEIAVRSRYLALGYWREPELTASRFLEDAAEPALRTYLTGDLGRMLPDGLLQYVGRKDFVPKVRGEWVDVDAVEQALATAPGVHEAVVTIREHADNGARVCAYVVSRDTSKPSVEVLRKHVAALVPSAAVPSAWVFMPRLPLNANMKVDRRALPEPGPANMSADDAYGKPRNPLELQLARIWTEVLGIDRIGVHDNVFDLGADSLQIARARNRLLNALTIAVPIALLFDKPTIDEQANELDKLIAPTPSVR